MHYHNPDSKLAHVVIVYRDVQKMGPPSHRALGVNAMHTCKVLRKNGIQCDPLGVWPPKSLLKDIKAFPTCTHCVIEAPWIPVDVMIQLLVENPQINWVVRTPYQIGFLEIEPGAVNLLRDLMHMQDVEPNLTVATNSDRLSVILESVYQG